MSKALQHPLRALGAALTLAGTALVFVLLLLPATASGGRPSGKDGVWHYETNNFGKSEVHSIGHNRLFAIIGKNLNHAVEVYCWDTLTNDWVTVSNWDHFDTYSRVLWNVDVNDDCTGSAEHGMLVEFDDGNFVEGPRIIIT